MASYWLLTLGRWFWGMGVSKKLGAGKGLIVGALDGGWQQGSWLSSRLLFASLPELLPIVEFTICKCFVLGGVGGAK